MTTTYGANTIRLISQFTYKGKTHKTSNAYHFTGVALSTADGTELSTDIANLQAGVMANAWSAHIVTAYVYSSGDHVARQQVDFTSGGSSAGIAATGSYMTSTATQANQAEVCYILTAQCGRDAKGRVKRVRKFIHPSLCASASNDQAATMTAAGVTAWGALASGGIGSKNWLSANPAGVQITSPWTVDKYVGTRQLRRGKKRA